MTIIFYFMTYRLYLPNLGSLSHPHGLEEAPVVHQSGLGHLVDVDHIIGHFLSTSPIMPNSGSLCHPHGLEEAPVAHRPDPGQLQRIWLIFELCTATYDPNIP